jgi:hypothetical protein
MKMALYILGVLFVLFCLFQLYFLMTANRSETQVYSVVKKEDEFEIRYYPAATMARVSSSLRSYRELGSFGFSKLAKYIFGGNKDNKQIAMTSPVHMAITDSGSTMSFVMPAQYTMEALPVPISSDVILIPSPAEYVAVKRFGGFASNDRIQKEIELLKGMLEKHRIVYEGNFRFLGYNPPFQLIGRRNEVVVSIPRKAK